MIFRKIVLLLAAALLSTVFISCTGNKSQAPLPKGTIGSETTSAGKRLAKLVGTEVVVSNAADDQQNPQVIYLQDKNLYFTVWEDYKNRNESGSDIFGQFLRTDGSVCGANITITSAVGNQSAPTVAYQPGGVIAVAWQDSIGTGSAGWLGYASISDLPTPQTCDVAPTVSDASQVGYNHLQEFGITPVSGSTSFTIAGDSTGGTDTTGGAVVPGYVVPKSIRVYGTYSTENTDDATSGPVATVDISDDGLGSLAGSNASGSINYMTGNLEVTLRNEVDANTVATFTVTYERLTGGVSERSESLLSRKYPKLTYDPMGGGRFILVWVESRNITSYASVLCFGIRPVTWETGDSNFVGYLFLDSSLSPMLNLNNIIGPDVLNTSPTTTMKLLAHESTADKEIFEYDFFTQANNVDVAADPTAAETLLVWEGIRKKATLTCELNKTTGTIESSFVNADADDGKVHIYGAFEKEITKLTPHKFIDFGNSNTGTNPTVAVDPVSSPRKFLVAWEDTRDGSNNKIYGQLINSGGGLDNENRIISFQDYDGDGSQDPNVASSRQTKPFVTFDPVNRRFFATWTDGRNGISSAENLDVFGQYVNSDGSLSGSNYAISTATSNQDASNIAYNNSTDTNGKQFFAVWTDGRNGNPLTTASDVYGQRFSLGQPQLTLLNTDGTTLAPALLDFGTINVQQRINQSIKIKNTGDTSLSIDCVDPMPVSPFSLQNVPDAFSQCGDDKFIDLPPSGETTLTVSFLPDVGGTFNSSFFLKSDGGEHQVFLSGIGNPPTMTISEGDSANDGQLDFGNVTIGQSKDKTLAVTNNSAITYNVTEIKFDNSSKYSLVSPTSFPVALSPGSSLTLKVRLSPTAEGIVRSQLTITTDKSLTQNINLTGTGTLQSTTEPPDTGGGTNGSGNSNEPPKSSAGKSGCFIATAAYGSYLDPHVMVLRHFRDNVLLTSPLGTQFVTFYYKYSPPIADFIARHDALRLFVRLLLTPLIYSVKYPLFALMILVVSIGFGVQRVRSKLTLSSVCREV